MLRQSGQTSQDELNRLDLKTQLLQAEQSHYEKVNKVTKIASGLSNSFKDDDDDDDDDGNSQQKDSAEGSSSSAATSETPLERKRRLLREAERLDKDDSDSDGSGKNSNSDSDNSDR